MEIRKQKGRETAEEGQHQKDLQRLHDLVITDCTIQKDMKRLVGARSICLDAYGTDQTGQRYD